MITIKNNQYDGIINKEICQEKYVNQWNNSVVGVLTIPLSYGNYQEQQRPVKILVLL